MKAAIYSQPGAPDVFHYTDVGNPVPGDNEVLIWVEPISIEGGDLINRGHTHQGANEVVGYAAAGEIIQLGGAVTGFRVGQKVATFN